MLAWINNKWRKYLQTKIRAWRKTTGYSRVIYKYILKPYGDCNLSIHSHNEKGEFLVIKERCV